MTQISARFDNVTKKNEPKSFFALKTNTCYTLFLRSLSICRVHNSKMNKVICSQVRFIEGSGTTDGMSASSLRQLLSARKHFAIPHLYAIYQQPEGQACE